MEKTKALVLLNMGAARNKNELETFLLNMFNDENILGIKSKLLRSIVASIIVMFRHEKAWENYKLIGGHSPLHKLSEELIHKLNKYLPQYYILTAMRYTPLFAKDTIKKIKQKNITNVTLLPLYPHYSTTTTKSSLEDFLDSCEYKFNLKIISGFYKNDLYNKAIIQNIKNTVNDYASYNLIFSAHGLPQSIINNGDPYEKQIEHNVQILRDILQKDNIYFSSIHLAYQSKVGPMKWLQPSLDEKLKEFKNQNVLIYPISFIIDNSETVFELNIEYKQIAINVGVKDYKVIECLNSSDIFCEAIQDIIN